MRHLSALLSMPVILALGCGPGTPGSDDSPAPPEPEWAYGWWMDAGGLQEHFEWGDYIAQLEIRPDGTVVQMIDYCEGEDWSYESRWELQADGAVRILPASGAVVPFQYPTQESRHIDLRQGEDSCQLEAVRISSLEGTEFPPILLERGRWCTGTYLPEFDECEMQKFCGATPPVCE
jgi:hypothetical protein